jgi:hypothetical protein
MTDYDYLYNTLVLCTPFLPLHSNTDVTLYREEWTFVNND